jgi:hypothetical protein
MLQRVLHFAVAPPALRNLGVPRSFMQTNRRLSPVSTSRPSLSSSSFPTRRAASSTATVLRASTSSCYCPARRRRRAAPPCSSSSSPQARPPPVLRGSLLLTRKVHSTPITQQAEQSWLHTRREQMTCQSIFPEN